MIALLGIRIETRTKIFKSINLLSVTYLNLKKKLFIKYYENVHRTILIL